MHSDMSQENEKETIGGQNYATLWGLVLRSWKGRGMIWMPSKQNDFASDNLPGWVFWMWLWPFCSGRLVPAGPSKAAGTEISRSTVLGKSLRFLSGAPCAVALGPNIQSRRTSFTTVRGPPCGCCLRVFNRIIATPTTQLANLLYLVYGGCFIGFPSTMSKCSVCLKQSVASLQTRRVVKIRRFFCTITIVMF
jgi:hypothetical protein